MPRERVNIQAVVASYDAPKRWAELQGDWPSFFLYRPLSFALTPAFAWLGMSASAVTLLGLALSLALPAVAWWAPAPAFGLVCAMVVCVHVLDCVDGNLARVTGTASRAGAVLDAFADLVFWAAFFVSVGVLADRPWGVQVGLLCAVLVLLNRALRDTYALTFHARAEFDEAPPPRLGLARSAWIAVIGVDRAFVFAVLLGGVSGRLAEIILAIAAYIACVFIGAVVLVFSSARREEAQCKD